MQIPMWAKKKNTVKDVQAFLEVMGRPDRKLKVIHVAGTNGKGSVCAFLTASLNEAGVKTGTFVSPHLVDIRERFLINGQMVEETAFEASFARVKETADHMVALGYCHPTFFEFLFYMALDLFVELGVELAILETGLGGRLDATNAVEAPLACVITSISLDHTQYLGNTVEEIAGEKAGIIKWRRPVIFDATLPVVLPVIEGRAFILESPRYPVSECDWEILEGSEDGFAMLVKRKGEQPLNVYVPFAASYQAQNAALAIRTLEVIRGLLDGPAISDEDIIRGIAKTRWQGRMERVKPGIYLDGAHNPGGIAAFTQAVNAICKESGKRPRLLFAVAADKDYPVMVRALCAEVGWESIGVVQASTDRALDADVLAQTFSSFVSCAVNVYETPQAALEKLADGADTILFCAGSLYLIGDIENVLRGEAND